MPEATPSTLGAVLYDGFELLDFYGPLEMFGNVGPTLRIATVAAQAGQVRSAQGPSGVARYGFADAPELDLLLLPGGIGTLAALEDEALLGFLRERAPAARVVLSVCTGSALLARAGLLDGRRATSNKLFFSIARSQGEKVTWVESARWVEDGPYFTSSGVSAGMDAALAAIAREFGPSEAERIAELTEYEWHRDPHVDPFARFLDQGPSRPLLPPHPTSQ